MSTNHKVDIFPLGPLTKHPNADSLSLIKIGDTDYSYVAKTEEWQDKVGRLVAWIPPDSVVKLERKEFSFLAKERVKAKKLRGIVSYGLLVLAPEGLNPGDDGATVLEVSHYEPPVRGDQRAQFGSTESCPGPDFPNYDIEAYLKYAKKVFTPGEPVYVSEKLHGACGRYVFTDKMHCGSRAEWKSEYSSPSKLTLAELTERIGDPIKAQNVYDKISKPGTKKNLWHVALTDEVRAYCTANPGHCVYGEVFGNVQDMKYGATTEVWFRAFDIMLPSGQWMDAVDFLATPLTKVPGLAYSEPFDFETVRSMCEGKSLIANHIREGCVVKPLRERWSDIIGRVSLKIINPEYLER